MTKMLPDRGGPDREAGGTPQRTVVLASYQGERFIGAQLDSILPQLSPDDEVIVSDDSSTDRTLQVVAACSDPRIRILANTTRVGYVENFGRALAQARGQVILFSDQDDVWLPNKISALDAALRRAACVASDAVIVDEDLRVLQPSYFAWRRTPGFSPLSIYLKPPIVGATLACRSAYLKAMLPLPRRVPHDFWLTLNAALDRELHVLQVPLILYRRHADAHSVSGVARKRRKDVILAERARMLAAIIARRMGARYFRRGTSRATG
jgi:glycosyltransferase involved in cell wall biosynthesis